MPILLIFLSRIVWSTLSKALAKSRYTESTLNPSSNIVQRTRSAATSLQDPSANWDMSSSRLKRGRPTLRLGSNLCHPRPPIQQASAPPFVCERSDSPSEISFFPPVKPDPICQTMAACNRFSSVRSSLDVRHPSLSRHPPNLHHPS